MQLSVNPNGAFYYKSVHTETISTNTAGVDCAMHPSLSIRMERLTLVPRRSRIERAEYREKGSKYFCNLEKLSNEKKNIHLLKNDDDFFV